MSSLKATNVNVNKVTSSSGNISGDKATGRIELEFAGAIKNVFKGTPKVTISIEDGGFAIIDFGNGLIETYTETVSFSWGDKIDYPSKTTIKIKGSKISGLTGTKSKNPVEPDEYGIVSNVFKIISFEFPKDSPQSINCNSLFVNGTSSTMSTVYGELPIFDDRISNMDSMFSDNPNISGEIPKLPKNLQSASSAFLNCTGLTGPSKELIQQFITVNKPYFDFNYENMVLGCEKCITSWFSTNCGGDHDVIEYLTYTSSKNATSTAYPYILLNLPRGLKDKHQYRAVYKNGDRVDSYTSFVFCSRDTIGKNGGLLTNFGSRLRFDQNTAQYYITPKSLKQERPCDFCISTKSLTKARHLECYSLDFNELTTSVTTNSTQNTSTVLTLFCSQTGSTPSNPGQLSIGELDIWDDEGYLLKLRSNGTSMIDLVSGTTYSSSSSTSFTTDNVEMRDVDKEDLLFWEKFTGKTLTVDFWTEYDTALQEYKADPTKTEKWVVSFDKTTDTFSSNCPYFETAPTKPLVNFFLTKCTGVYPSYSTSTGKHITARSPFASDTNQLMYFPNLVTGTYIIANLTAQQTFPIVPNVSSTSNLASGWKYKNVQHVFLPNSTNISWTFNSGYATESYVWAPNSTSLNYLYVYTYGSQAYLKKVVLNGGKLSGCFDLSLDYSPTETVIINADLSGCTNIKYMIFASNNTAKSTKIKVLLNNKEERVLSFPKATNAIRFAKGRAGFDQALNVPSLSDGTEMFANSGLSAYNLQLTLESLPIWTDGTTHTITIGGCPGAEYVTTEETFEGVENCPVFVNDRKEGLRKAFAKAVNGGWSVELGTAQNAVVAALSLDLDEENTNIPMWYKITESEDGDYKDSDGKKYLLHEVGSAFSKDGVNIGYTLFNSKEECLNTWNLTQIIEETPQVEEEEIEETEEI